jgi:N-acetylmuramoyl-L-alanine amidase
VGRTWIAIAALFGASSLAWVLLAHTTASGDSATEPHRWPGDATRLTPPPLQIPEGFGRRRIFIDPGHGAANNSGNRSSRCQDEQDFTLSLALDIAPRLEASGGFDVALSRQPGELVAYRDRVAAAEAFEAEVFVSLHSDVRGKADPERSCPTSRDAPGFSVLWSDEGSPALVASRLALSRRTAEALTILGLSAYGGEEYAGLYAGDSTPGVFVDRHDPDERIFVLREPTMPSIIVETHNAWDDREAQRWTEPSTRDAFADALAQALVSFLIDNPRALDAELR